MEPEQHIDTKESVWKPLTIVTPLSKYLAMILFIILPFVGGLVGYHFAIEKGNGQHYETEENGGIESANREESDISYLESYEGGAENSNETQTEADEVSIDDEEILPARLTPRTLVGSSYDTDNSLLKMQTRLRTQPQSHGYALFDISIPANAEFLFFDLSFDTYNASDWLEVVLNGELIGTFHANLYSGSGSTLYFDFFGEQAGNAELYFLLVDADGTDSSLTASNFNFITASSQ